MQQVFRFWNSRMLLLEGRILIFNPLNSSVAAYRNQSIVYLTFLAVIPNSLIEELQFYIWSSSCPKITHNTLCNNFENGGLKHVDISSKI